jgi:hypothetical protein
MSAPIVLHMVVDDTFGLNPGDALTLVMTLLIGSVPGVYEESSYCDVVRPAPDSEKGTFRLKHNFG